MELGYYSETLRKKCESCKFFNKDIYMNTRLTKVIRDLEASPTLLDIKLNKSLKLHPLKWSRKFELAIDVDGRKNPYRLIFETLNWENVCNDFLNNGIFKTVTQIKILDISNHYKN